MKTAIAVIVVIIIAIAAYFLFFRTASAPAPQPAAPIEATTTQETSASSTPSAATVTYTNTGFSPSTVTVAQGQAVTFVNNSSEDMWVASNPHPIHNGYSGTTVDQHCPDTAGTAFDECTTVSAGGSYTFTFQKVGTWGYHNHADHGMTGTVVVTN